MANAVSKSEAKEDIYGVRTAKKSDHVPFKTSESPFVGAEDQIEQKVSFGRAGSRIFGDRKKLLIYFGIGVFVVISGALAGMILSSVLNSGKSKNETPLRQKFYSENKF